MKKSANRFTVFIRIILVHTILALVWLNAFPLQPDLDWLDISLESVYYVSILVAYLYARELHIPQLSFGLALMSSGLFIDVLDEFTREPEFWNTLFQGALEIGGALIFSTALIRSHHRMHRELERSQQLIEAHRHMALHDPLTGIPNRTLLTDRLRQALAQAKRYQHQLAVLYIDLNDFKLVNDNYGHDAGDQLLKDIAARINRIIRTEDTLARIGGDEFIVVMSKINNVEAAHFMSDKIHSALEEPFYIGGNEIRAGSTIGIASYPADADTVEALLKIADAAMYSVKNERSTG